MRAIRNHSGERRRGGAGRRPRYRGAPRHDRAGRAREPSRGSHSDGRGFEGRSRGRRVGRRISIHAQGRRLAEELGQAHAPEVAARRSPGGRIHPNPILSDSAARRRRAQPGVQLRHLARVPGREPERLADSRLERTPAELHRRIHAAERGPGRVAARAQSSIRVPVRAAQEAGAAGEAATIRGDDRQDQGARFPRATDSDDDEPRGDWLGSFRATRMRRVRRRCRRRRWTSARTATRGPR